MSMEADNAEDIRAELEAMRQQMKDLLEKQEAAAATPVTVVVQRERRLRNFSGSGADPVNDWIEDARAMISAQGLTAREAADYLVSHLEGPARREIRCRPPEDMKNADALLRTLRETFGERASVSQLQRSFYERKQLEGETITEYSHQIVNLLDRLENVSPEHVVDRDRMLRDQLVENVREPYLRWELKKQVEQDQGSSFITCREIAIQWTTETEMGRRKVKNYAQRVDEQPVEQQGGNEVVKMLAEMMAKQQALLEGISEQQKELAKSQEMLRQVATGKQGGQSMTRDRRAVVCYNCNKPGHYARDCRSGSNNKSKGNCYFCGASGHQQHECASLKEARAKARNGQPTLN